MVNVHERRLAAIMFADIVGYSRMMSLDEERTLKLLEDLKKFVLLLLIHSKEKF